jgi:diguanylate cyclase (GGDEF)-like protein
MLSKDPRLVELEILSEIERKTYVRLHMSPHMAEEERYGLPYSDFRDLIVHLVIEDFVNGPANLTYGGREGQTMEDLREEEKRKDFKAIIDSQSLYLRPNHKGRLRLWALRDELLSHKQMEPFGIMRSGENWKKDVQVYWAFLTDKEPFSFMLCDLDHFKSVNDNVGHDKGDLAIKLYLQTIQDLTEKAGTAYRIGGDEVLVVLPRKESEAAQDLAEAIQKEIERLFLNMEFLKLHKLKPTTSIGLLTLHSRVEPDVVYQVVDKAVYSAKKKGRNRVEVSK